MQKMLKIFKKLAQSWKKCIRLKALFEMSLGIEICFFLTSTRSISEAKSILKDLTWITMEVVILPRFYG